MSELSVTGIGVSIGAPPRNAQSQTKVEVPRPVVPATSERPDVPARDAPAASNIRLSIVHDEATDRYVFKSVDTDTGEVIRQYPTEPMLRQIARVREITGLTVDSAA